MRHKLLDEIANAGDMFFYHNKCGVLEKTRISLYYKLMQEEK